jgi:hypothetical protein
MGFEGMKVSWKVLFWVLVAGVGSLQAQNCNGELSSWSHSGSNPTFLTLITGYNDRPSNAFWESTATQQPQGSEAQAKALLFAGKPAEASKVLATQLQTLLSDSTFDSTSAVDGMAKIEVGAMAALAEGKLADASNLLAHARKLPMHPFSCRIRSEQLLVSYLQRYGMEAPLFAHFNSGFYNYLEDSLRWKPKAPDANEYLVALNVVALAYQVDPKRPALYLELLGDLLSKEPNRFNANYMAALAYLRAGMLAGEAAKEAYDRKAIFALEAPRQAEYRFNQYRFTQLQKALYQDVDSANARFAATSASESAALQAGSDPLARFGGRASEALISSTFESSDPGKLAAILQKSRTQLEDRLNENKRYAGDVDLKKEVKKDGRFNAFALFLILTIVAAIVLIWRKVRKGSAA